jgi:hypothetical protein
MEGEFLVGTTAKTRLKGGVLGAAARRNFTLRAVVEITDTDRFACGRWRS